MRHDVKRITWVAFDAVPPTCGMLAALPAVPVSETANQLGGLGMPAADSALLVNTDREFPGSFLGLA
jgi:hypothetical protein